MYGFLRSLLTWHCPHLLLRPSAAAAPLLLGAQRRAAIDRYLLLQRSTDETDRRTDGRTSDHCIDPAPHTIQAAPITIKYLLCALAYAWYALLLRMDPPWDGKMSISSSNNWDLRQSNNSKWRWWMWMVAANFGWTHSPSQLTWSEGWRPPDAFIKCTAESNRRVAKIKSWFICHRPTDQQACDRV